MEIKPCRFCGSIPFVMRHSENLYQVECSLYFCDSVDVVFGDTREEAIEAWNAEQEGWY